MRQAQATWSGIVLKLRCHACSGMVSAGDATFLPGGIIRCPKCSQKSAAEMSKFMAEHAMECYECHAPFRIGDIRVGVVWKDGVFQALCDVCTQRYVPKRRDLFAGTPFARRNGLE